MLVTIKEAAAILGVKQHRIRKWNASGKLQSVRTDGGHRRFDRAYLERFRDGEPMPESSRISVRIDYGDDKYVMLTKICGEEELALIDCSLNVGETYRPLIGRVRNMLAQWSVAK